MAGDLRAFAALMDRRQDAWNAHDVEAIMAMRTARDYPGDDDAELDRRGGIGVERRVQVVDHVRGDRGVQVQRALALLDAAKSELR